MFNVVLNVFHAGIQIFPVRKTGRGLAGVVVLG